MRTAALSLALISIALGCGGTVERSQAGSVSGAGGGGTGGAAGAGSSAGSGGAAGAGSSSAAGGTGGSVMVCQPGTTVPCYSGPPGTAGIGQCQSGLQTCHDDGTFYGTCIGEVLPSIEQCAKPGDEDCNGVEPPACGGARWAHIFGNSADQFPNMTVADTAGNVYLVGGIYGSTNFGGSNLVSAGDADGFAAKFDAGGNHLWSKRFGDASEQTVTDVALGSTGELLMTGYYAGVIDLGGGPLPAGSYDSFIAKLTPDGDHVWSVRYGAAQQYDLLRAIAGDPLGDVLVAGYTGMSAQDILIGKFSGDDGSELWVKQISASGQQLIFESLDSDAAGNIFVAGQFFSTLTLGASTLSSAGANDIFVAKLDSSGTFLWAKRFGDSADQVPGAVVVDSQGSPVIVGNFQGKLSFDGQGELTSAGDYDIFVVKLAMDGTFQWSKRFGDGSRQASLRAAIDESDNLFLTGEMAGQVSFGGDPLQSAGQADLFLAKLDMSGNHLWSKRFGDSVSQIGRGVAVAPVAGWVYVTGYAQGTTDFGTGMPLASAGGYDIVLASFNP